MPTLVLELEQLPYALIYMPEGEGKRAIRRYRKELYTLLTLAVPPALCLAPEWEAQGMREFRRAVSQPYWPGGGTGLAAEFLSACSMVAVLSSMPAPSRPCCLPLTGWFSALHWALLDFQGDGVYVGIPPRPVGLDGEPLAPNAGQVPAQAVPEYIGEGTALGCSLGRCRCGCAVYSHHNYCYNCGALLRWDACTPA